MALHPSTQQTVDWRTELREALLSALTSRQCSKYRAACEIPWDLTSLEGFLDGTSTPYPKIVRRLARWLDSSDDQAIEWEATAKEHKRAHSGHGARSVLKTCAVPGCSVSRIVRLAQASRRSRHPWTCSRAHAGLIRLIPGPSASAANHVAFDALLKIGSAREFERRTGLSDREIRKLCTDPQYAPQTKTLNRLAAMPGIAWANLYPIHVEDKWSKNLERRRKRPKGSKAAKRIFGDRAGKARRESRIEKGGFPALSAAQRETALRKMEDSDYASALVDRLRTGKRRLSLRRAARSLQATFRRHHPEWDDHKVYELTIGRLRQAPFNVLEILDAQILLMPRPQKQRRGRKAEVDYFQVHDLHLQEALWRNIAGELKRSDPETLRIAYLQWRRGRERQIRSLQ